MIHSWAVCSRVVASLSLLPLPLAAYELVVRDVGASLLYAPADFDYSFSGGGVSRSGTDGFDSGYGIDFRGLYSFTGAGERHGFVADFGGGFVQQSYDAGGSMSLLGVSVGGGYGFALMDRWDLQGLARLGFGLTTLDIDASASNPGFSADGAYVSYGLSVAASYLVTDRWAVRAELGYNLMSTALDGSGSSTVDMDLTMPSFAVGIFWRVTSMPWRLE